MNINTMIAGAATVAASIALAATPEVTSVSMSQASNSRLVTITYSLANAPAVVTLDVQTNRTGAATAVEADWVSIGGEAVCNAQGDVWKKVGTSGTFNGTITWRPDHSWPDHVIANNSARAVVTAYALDNPPDYMVVDISAGARQNTQRYYPAVDFLPGSVLGQVGAVTNNPAYKTSMLVMRKIMAKGVTWTMGSTPNEPRRSGNAANEGTHQVSISDNYYIGIFEVTQGQWLEVATNSTRKAFFNCQDDVNGRPMDTASWYEIRATHCTAANGEDAVSTPSTGFYPDSPSADSFLGLLRLKTGIDFDLPSEAQWEFAARAGNGDCKYGNGTTILSSNDTNLDEQARFQYNNKQPIVLRKSQMSDGRATSAVQGGTAIVGSYKPNNWGLYDTLGNVVEFCVDSFQADISALGGNVCVLAEPVNKVCKGGQWENTANELRLAWRGGRAENFNGRFTWNLSQSGFGIVGFRVVCPVEIQ
jgi:formylglycine-generating enzyme required for sulfatase activity